MKKKMKKGWGERLIVTIFFGTEILSSGVQIFSGKVQKFSGGGGGGVKKILNQFLGGGGPGLLGRPPLLDTRLLYYHFLEMNFLEMYLETNTTIYNSDACLHYFTKWHN